MAGLMAVWASLPNPRMSSAISLPEKPCRRQQDFEVLNRQVYYLKEIHKLKRKGKSSKVRARIILVESKSAKKL
jgi:hypothetical protein